MTIASLPLLVKLQFLWVYDFHHFFRCDYLLAVAFLAVASLQLLLPALSICEKKDFGSPDSRFAAPLTNWGHLQNYQISPEMINSTNTKMSDPSEKSSSRNCIKNKKRQQHQQQHYTRSFASKKPYLCYTKKKRRKTTRRRCCWWWWICPDFDTKTNKKKKQMENCKTEKKEEREAL